MKAAYFLLVLLLPVASWGNPVPCPTTTSFADYLSLTSCTVADLTLSNFTFSSTALTSDSTAFSASDFSVKPIDTLYQGDIYFGLQYQGQLGQLPTQGVDTQVGFTVTSTNGIAEINEASLNLQGVVYGNGSITLTDTIGAGANTYTIQSNQNQPLSGVNFAPVTSVSLNTDLNIVGPAGIEYFTIKVSETPEPAAWTLLGLGLGALVLSSLRLRRSL